MDKLVDLIYKIIFIVMIMPLLFIFYFLVLNYFKKVIIENNRLESIVISIRNVIIFSLNKITSYNI